MTNGDKPKPNLEAGIKALAKQTNNIHDASGKHKNSTTME
jgi:hypothetical protein